MSHPNWYDHPEFIKLLRACGIMCAVVCGTVLFLSAVAFSPEAGLAVSASFFACSTYVADRIRQETEEVSVRHPHPGESVYYDSYVGHTARASPAEEEETASELGLGGGAPFSSPPQ